MTLISNCRGARRTTLKTLPKLFLQDVLRGSCRVDFGVAGFSTRIVSLSKKIKTRTTNTDCITWVSGNLALHQFCQLESPEQNPSLRGNSHPRNITPSSISGGRTTRIQSVGVPACAQQHPGRKLGPAWCGCDYIRHQSGEISKSHIRAWAC